MNSKSTILILFFTLLIDVMGFGLIIPILPKLIQELTGGTVGDASRYGGWLMFAFSLPLFLFAPVLGNLSDRFGRRGVLLVSVLGLGLDCLLQGFAPSITWLFIGRFLAGVMGASYATANSYIADVTPPEKRAERFGMLGAAFGVGFIIGPLSGGLLGTFGTRVPFFAAAGLSFINFLLVFFFLPESLSVENRRAFDWKKANPVGSLLRLRRYPTVANLALAFFLLNIAHHGVRTTWPYFTMERFKWDEAMIGYSLATVGVLYAIVQGGLIGKIIAFLGQKKTLYIGFLLYILGNFLFGIATEGWMVFLILIPYCIGGMEEPALQGILSGHVPANEQGELQGSLLSLIGITAIVGPPMMTEIFFYFTKPGNPFYLPGSPLFLGAFLTIFAFIITYMTLRKEN